MKKILLINSIIFYLIGLSILSYYLYLEFAPRVSASEFGTIVLLLSTTIFSYLGSLFLSKYLKSNKPMQIYLYLIFLMYILVLIKLTLFDSNYGRNGLNIFNFNHEYIGEYLQNQVNIIPFKTILEYIKRWDHIAIYNLFGNIIAFAPMGLFLPLLFKKQNKLKTFILTNIAIILTIELFQFLSLSGSFDIDDLILNLIGSLTIYSLFKVKKINHLILKIFIRTN